MSPGSSAASAAAAFHSSSLVYRAAFAVTFIRRGALHCHPAGRAAGLQVAILCSFPSRFVRMEKTSTFGSRATVASALAVRDRALSTMPRRQLSRDCSAAFRAFPASRVAANVRREASFALMNARLHSGD